MNPGAKHMPAVASIEEQEEEKVDPKMNQDSYKAALPTREDSEEQE